MIKAFSKSMPGLGHTEMWTGEINGNTMVRILYWTEGADPNGPADVEIQSKVSIVPQIPKLMQNFETICTGLPKGRGDN